MAFQGRGLPARELKRKLFHVTLGAAFLMVIVTWDLLMDLALLLFLIGFALSVAHSRRAIRPVGWVLRHFDREGDRLPGLGIISFFLGVLLTFFVFPKDIAIAGIAVMTFGDPMASVVGITLGSHPCPFNQKKTLEGTGAFLLTSFLAVVFLAGPYVAAVVAVGGGVVESFKHPKGSLLNDNVTIPLGAATAAMLLSVLFGL